MAERNFDDRLHDLFESTHDLIFFLKINGEIETANPAFLSTLGYEIEELKGKIIYDFIHPAYIDAYKKNREDVINNNVVRNVEVGFLSSDKQLIVGEGQVRCYYKNGEPAYTRCIFENKTARQQREKVIQENEKRLKAFLESGPDAVIIINEFQEILEWNSKAEQIFGFTREEINGKMLTETIIPPQHRNAHLMGMQHFLKTGHGAILNKTVEITALHKSGKEFYINLSISNVKIDDRWIFIAFLSDISERKRTEEELIKKEAELLQSKLMEKEKDKFISVASHELKTPITTIKAYCSLLQEMKGEVPENVGKYISKIDQYANKLTFLMNELLDVSKINIGQLNLSKKQINFQRFLAETIDSIQQITNSHRIVVDQNVETFVTADPVRIEQVITNVISNSAKYSPGKDVIRVSSYVQDKNLILAVTDEGIGISADNTANIFKRFYRINGSSNTFSGFGIGLYVSEQIIKQHSGKMWVESIVGNGSTFYFSLPLDL